MIKLELSQAEENEYPTQMTISEKHAEEIFDQLKTYFAFRYSDLDI